MNQLLKLQDAQDEKVVIQSELSYFELSHAQEEYEKNQKDGSIMLSINNETTEGIDASMDLTVADAEKLAYHILGMCAAVKND